jgi:hypothetical protein
MQQAFVEKMDCRMNISLMHIVVEYRAAPWLLEPGDIVSTTGLASDETKIPEASPESMAEPKCQKRSQGSFEI